MKHLGIVFLLLVTLKVSQAQVGLSYFPWQSELAINTNSKKLIWGDLRIATNTFFGNLSFEPALMLNLKRHEKYQLYTGLGGNFNFFNAFGDLPITNGSALYIGCRAPFIKSMPKLNFIFELSPYFNPTFSGGQLRSKIGIAYQF